MISILSGNKRSKSGARMQWVDFIGFQVIMQDAY